MAARAPGTDARAARGTSGAHRALHRGPAGRGAARRRLRARRTTPLRPRPDAERPGRGRGRDRHRGRPADHGGDPAGRQGHRRRAHHRRAPPGRRRPVARHLRPPLVGVDGAHRARPADRRAAVAAASGAADPGGGRAGPGGRHLPAYARAGRGGPLRLRSRVPGGQPERRARVRPGGGREACRSCSGRGGGREEGGGDAARAAAGPRARGVGGARRVAVRRTCAEGLREQLGRPRRGRRGRVAGDGHGECRDGAADDRTPGGHSAHGRQRNAVDGHRPVADDRTCDNRAGHAEHAVGDGGHVRDGAPAGRHRPGHGDPTRRPGHVRHACHVLVPVRHPQCLAAGHSARGLPVASAAPPPVAEVAVPADQQCADDATAACAGLRFGDPRLRLARTADTTDTRPGQQVTHTVTVTDSGEAAALFATVRNSIPAGAPLVSGRISQGTYDALTGIWQTGRIAAGGTATLTLTLHVPDPAAGTVMSARSEFLGSADPAPVIEHTCPDDPGSACAITRVTAP
ncbi:DUF11 domain-containing protein [Yinghuangia aomiensis]